MSKIKSSITSIIEFLRSAIIICNECGWEQEAGSISCTGEFIL